MNNVAIIGAGISGVSLGRMLQEQGYAVTLYEAKPQPGGLIRCTTEQGNLFHRVGGHVFNTKNTAVETWFWNIFNKNEEFLLAKRNAKILIADQYIGYPIEDHVFELNNQVLVKQIIQELLQLHRHSTENHSVDHFAAFLKRTFGPTLYELYFKPYNEKIWKTDLEQMPLSWLDGKLPMPKIEEIFLHNFLRQEESAMVHSSFYYPKQGGSQFIIDKITSGLKVNQAAKVLSIERKSQQWLINKSDTYDYVVYTGDIRALFQLTYGLDEDVMQCLSQAKKLLSNGTSTLLCYTDPTDLSWLYLPDKNIAAHRIIYTGNFSESNNQKDRLTCTVEFSGRYTYSEMLDTLKHLPGNLQAIASNYEPNSYVIQESNTKTIVRTIKHQLEPLNLFLLGRFAEWEYYNMDKCIEQALALAERIMTKDHTPVEQVVPIQAGSGFAEAKN